MHTCTHTHTHTHFNTFTLTSEYDEAVACLSVAQDAASQQHVLIGQDAFNVPPVQRPREAVQLVVRGLTHHLACTHTHTHTQ